MTALRLPGRAEVTTGTLRTWVRDWWLPGGLAALLLLNVRGGEGSGYPQPVALSAAVMLAAVVALGWRRRRPVTVAVAVSGAVTGYLLLLHDDLAVQPALEPFLVVLAAMFSLSLHASRPEFPLGLAAAAFPLLAVELAAVTAGRDIGTVVPTLVLWGAAVVMGRLLHHRGTEITQAHERIGEVQRRAEEAAAAERARIARELHDVVAHALSVVVLHAGVERRLLGDCDSSTSQALETIERTGRAALTELRQLLGLLREPGQDQTLEPLPSLDQLDRLVAAARSAGHEVTVEVSGGGDEAGVPAGVGISAYRIVQEALTNVLKHAPGAPVVIRVRRGTDALSVEVENGTPTGAEGVEEPARLPEGLPAGGHGLPGMQERVRLYGGTLTTRHRPGGGFVVAALLPQDAT